MDALLKRWHAVPPRSRLMFAALVAAAVVAALLAWALQRDARVALFAASLRPEQVAEVSERLAEWNVAFVAGADNVRVDARRRNELLLRLSLAGLPHPHRPTSSETLEKAGPLEPQSVLDAQAREGLAGDLAAALRGLEGISDAQVIVAAPRPAAFADESPAPAGAGVRLSLLPGARLSAERIAGIRQFVAAAVPGLDAAHVALLDDRGVNLEATPSNGSDDASALQNSLQSVLDEAVGSGATIVRVRVERDMRAREVQTLRRAPLGNPLHRVTYDERYANLKKSFVRKRSDDDRGDDVRAERTETAPGGLERVSVAVAVDAARRLDLGKIRRLAIATLGLLDGRDSVRVEALPFAHAAPSRAAPLWALLGFGSGLIPPLLAAFGLVLAGRVLARPLERAIDALAQRTLPVRGDRSREGRSFSPALVRGALLHEPPHAAAALLAALPAATASAVLELYPADERAAIVARMQRVVAPAVPDDESLLRRV